MEEINYKEDIGEWKIKSKGTKGNQSIPKTERKKLKKFKLFTLLYIIHHNTSLSFKT